MIYIFFSVYNIKWKRDSDSDSEANFSIVV